MTPILLLALMLLDPVVACHAIAKRRCGKAVCWVA
jgi:hypothetical protein